MAGSYLKRSRHGTNFYFRRRVPDDLRRFVGKPYLVKSTGTGARREAGIIARTFATQTDHFFRHLRAMHDSDDADNLKVELIFKADFFDFGGLKSIHVEADTPEEQEQATAMLNSTLRSVVPAQPTRPEGLPFSEALTNYYENAQIKPTTRRTYSSRLDHAQAYFGADRDVRHIEQGDLSEYSRHVKQTVPDATTQGHYIRTIATFLNFHRIDKGWGTGLTTKTLVPKIDTPDSEDRDSFTVDQISVLFDNARKYKINEPCKYWTALAIAFTGCRIEELAQIHIETDLQKDDVSGVWFLNLNGKLDPDGVARKSLKNKSSWRCIPIHSALVEHGFVDFLKAQVRAGYTRPFEQGWKPSLFNDGTAYKWSHYITNWGGREINKLRKSGALVDAENKLSYFHSMRHLISGLMSRAGISPEASEAAMGHKYAGGDRERYQKLKSDPVLLSKMAIEPGLIALAELLDR